MKYELVIFDLDGTLLNTIEDLGTAVNHSLSQRALPLHTMEEYRGNQGVLQHIGFSRLHHTQEDIPPEIHT